MADGHDKFDETKAAPAPDASAALHHDAYSKVEAPAPAADKTAPVGDQTVAAATDKTAAPLDVSHESQAVQERFKGTPNERMAQSHENIGKLFASMTTPEGKDMMTNCVKEFCASQAAHPQLAALMNDHVKTA